MPSQADRGLFRLLPLTGGWVECLYHRVAGLFEPDGTISACLVPVVIEETGHPVVQTPDPTPCEWEQTE